ncbi:GGDEF domain-containing protein [Mycolicibacterium sp.]|uniref:GGDEF domain-containing protein n=1 Tax=Mycolicibacterium sp. TaxID=2320850 RepID=UPI003D09E06E
MYPLRSLADAEGRVIGRQQVRLLRIYLSATTFLFLWGVTFTTVIPIRRGPGSPTGGIIAIVLGVAALAYLARRPRSLTPAVAAAVAATPAVMAYHVSMTAEYVCLIATMFLAMYIRAFYPPRQALAVNGILTAVTMAAVAVAPAPKVGVLTFLIIGIAIMGAAESFGLVMRALLEAACTDPMTGLLNRAGWEIATADLVARLRASAGTVTVVALDIDNLKTLNDTYGHDAGDRRITEYARAWRRAAPRGAVLARLGGDEFAACIAGRDSAAVNRFLDEIRSRTPQVSVGTATAALPGAVVAQLLSRADAALYRGRGRPLRQDVPPPPLDT